ncbi:hypothetical protein M970_070390 [Encephalitozoon cuniculi EcunIII-L]|uniref:BRCA2 OB1 domain-containing protein n=1 Tax=Encephalitozoon cuniculi TaxID=6035 RepID=M1KM00_ENCCN|nr:hypothetical protein ECU07_0440 [Encephalitozoon cuniculi]KMV65768.1 hypothetical protein M970_070390 [Encephalitozoon cuniculi EcunIII-L]UYI27201.1 oligonucleotide/oligosaccharide-binding domain-containing protein [Encephalitozoon cuniculi]
MDADSEVGFESFFQSSSNREDEGSDLLSGLDSIQMSCEDMLFFSSDNTVRKELRACESLEQENQTFYDFDSDSLEVLEDTEKAEEYRATEADDLHGLHMLGTDGGHPTTSPRKRPSLEPDNDPCRSHADLESPVSDTVFSGFTTGSRKKIQVRKESIDSAYKMFRDEEVEKLDAYPTALAPPKPDDRPEKEEAGMDPRRVYEEIERRFPQEDADRVFAQFTWSWIYFFFGRRWPEFSDLVDRIEEQVRVRLESEYSVLRRIVEGDDVPWRYMILLVVGIDKERIEVFDGYYSLYALYDDPLRRRIEKNEIRVGFKLRVFGADLEGGRPMSIFDTENVFLRLHHNGIQVVHSRRRLGYRKKMSFRLKISDVLGDGGPVSCIEGTIAKVIETKYLVKVENYSCTTESLEPELDRIEDLARKAQRVFSSHDIRISMYTKLLIRDDSGECTVTWWNPIPDIKEGQMIRFVYLNPSRSKGLHLNTSRRGYAKLLV